MKGFANTVLKDLRELSISTLDPENVWIPIVDTEDDKTKYAGSTGPVSRC